MVILPLGESRIKKLVKEVGDMISLNGLKASVSVFVAALVLSGAGLTLGALAHDEQVELESAACTSQEGIPCTTMCGPNVVNEFKVGDERYTEMSQSRQINILSATSIDFTTPCISGSHAVSGGYIFLPEGSTIDMDEIRMTSQRFHNDPATQTGSWIVSIHRERSDNVDNCLNVEVRALCVR